MARVSTVAWVRLAVVLALAGAALVAPPFRGVGLTEAVAQVPTGPINGQAAFLQGKDSYRSGDFETAVLLFQQAQANPAAFSPAQQEELTRWLQITQQARQGRQLATTQFHQAEADLQLGQSQEAQAIFKSLATNPYLATADRTRLLAYLGQAPKSEGLPASSASQSSGELARAQLAQARVLMARGNFEEAQTLASLAGQSGFEFRLGEDSPQKVLTDIDKNHKDAQWLLAASRTALQRGDLDSADRLAHQAQMWGSPYAFNTWNDSPARVLKEIQAARITMAAPASPSPAPFTMPARSPEIQPARYDEVPPIPGSGHAPASSILQVKAELPAGAMPAGQPVVEEGPAMGYTPGNQGLAGCPVCSTTTDAGSECPPPGSCDVCPSTNDPRAMLQQARQLYQFNRLDEAEQLALQAKGLMPNGWGSLDNSPDRLLVDIGKAKVRRDQQDSLQVLAEARSLFQQGNLEEARLKAHLADQLHGPGPWETGDRPQLLLAQIDATQRSQLQHQSPGIPIVDATTGPAARQLLVEAHQLQAQGRLVEARQKALEARRAAVSFGPNEESPDMVLLQLSSQAVKQIDGIMQRAGECVAAGQTDPGQMQRAENLLLEARQLAGNFGLDIQPIEARLAWLHQTQGQTPGALVGGTRPVEAGQVRGMELLDQARLELKRGETGNARRLSEEAFRGPYGVQPQAEAMLRTIGAEEFNQRCLVANRSFDAGMSCFMRKDYTQSSNIFHNLDSALLSPERQAKLRELILMPELQPQAVVQAAAKMPASDGSPGEPGKAMVSDAGSSPKTPEQNYARQVQAMQDIQFQALRDKGFKASREAATAAQAGNFDQSVDILNTYLDSLKNSSLEPERAALLRKPIEHRIQMFQTMKDQAAAAQKKIDSQAAFVQGKLRQVKAEENKDKQVTSLMAEYHSLYEQGKYAEAEVKAAQALELDPGNPQVSAAVQMARMARNHAIYDKIKHDKEDMFLAGVNDAEKVGPPVNSDNPLAFNGQVWDRAKVRKGSKDFELLNKKTNKEREIEHRLDTPTSLDFKETPLRQVLEDLSATNQINIVPDEPALNDAGISLDRPLNMKLEGVSLKSALDLLLGQAHLTYVIKDEVLLVTTEAHARGKMIQKIYPVADIVIPIENHGNLDNPMVRALQQGSAPTTPMGGPGSYPWRNDVQGASMVSTGGSMADMANQPAASSPGSMNSPRPPGQTLQELLMELITNTVAPGSWSKVGGQATIDYFPLGMALVVTQTPDIQEQIADLLTALRRLQDLEVAVEVRFITLDEAFYERIGVNFSVDVLNKGSKATQTLNQLAVTNGNASQVTGPVTVGLTPGGSFTSALDIPITNSSFGPAIPPFGGFPNAPGADGGISLGLAFLSDIQVFMFMEAAQADRRTNVMQAPKITLFNGQTSTLSITDNQFFVTNVQVTGFGGQLVFNPQNTLQQTGVSLSMNAVVTADRRFVRMSLTPVLSNIASPVTALFPITAFITPVLEGNVPGPPIPFTQYVQQPATTTVSVQTTVMVPDGGTVLLGGLKTLREGRNEFGPPILSKIPYINRLFKNVGYGREAESLLIMVTPRIIINEEEEAIQTGEGGGAQAPPAAGAP